MGKDEGGNERVVPQWKIDEEYDNRFSTYVWNSKTGAFFGRTGVAWAKLIIFYMIFFTGLAAFSGVCFYIFYQTLTEDRPKWILGESLIGTNPGMGYRPMPDREVSHESSLIWYQQNSTTSNAFWYKQLEDYMTSVGIPVESKDEVINCSYNSSQQASEKRSCRVDVTEFKGCNKKNRFGYPTGEPCILLKLNRIYGWKPDGYGLDSEGKYNKALLTEELDDKVKNDKMPEQLKEFIFKGIRNEHKDHIERFLSTVWISCEGENTNDKENITPDGIGYYPQMGIPGYYFPYYKQEGYQSPFIFIQLTNPTKGVLLNIECKAWARNIIHDRANRLGSVHFEVMID